MYIVLKGCQKSIIMIKDTGSEIFDQAYFIIKDTESCTKMHKTDMIREANRIIDENLLGVYFSGDTRKKAHIVSSRICFFLGMLFGAFAVALLWAIVTAT